VAEPALGHGALSGGDALHDGAAEELVGGAGAEESEGGFVEVNEVEVLLYEDGVLRGFESVLGAGWIEGAWGDIRGHEQRGRAILMADGDGCELDGAALSVGGDPLDGLQRGGVCLDRGVAEMTQCGEALGRDMLVDGDRVARGRTMPEQDARSVIGVDEVVVGEYPHGLGRVAHDGRQSLCVRMRLPEGREMTDWRNTRGGTGGRFR